MKYVVVVSPEGAEGRNLFVTKDGKKATDQFKKFRSGSFDAVIQASFDGWHVVGTKVGRGELYFVAVCSTEEEANRGIADHSSQSNIDITQYSVAEADDGQITETTDDGTWDDAYANQIQVLTTAVESLEKLMVSKPGDLLVTTTQRRWLDSLIDRLKTIHNNQLI